MKKYCNKEEAFGVAPLVLVGVKTPKIEDSEPNKFFCDRNSHALKIVSFFVGETVTHFFYLHLIHCCCMHESKK